MATLSPELPITPTLSAVGCVGRITSYSETEDGRYLVTLTGICRFGVAQELPAVAAMLVARPKFWRGLAAKRTRASTARPEEAWTD